MNGAPALISSCRGNGKTGEADRLDLLLFVFPRQKETAFVKVGGIPEHHASLHESFAWHGMPRS